MNQGDCPRCGRVPEAPSGAGRLFIWPPLGHTAGKLRSALRDHGFELGDGAEADAVVVLVPAATHGLLSNLLHEVLTRAEARDSRVLFMADGAVPGLADMGRVDRVETYVARGQSGWLLALMREQRVKTLFQPIFHAAEPTRVFAHECLLRGVDESGADIPPGIMFDIAGRADLIFPLDRLARTTAVANAAAARAAGHIFINFTPAAVYDPANCLRTTLAAVEAAGVSRDRVVFEVIETERIGDAHHLARVLAFYRDAGFQVALDDLGGGFAGLGLLPSLRPDFVKLDRAMVDGVHADRVKAIIIERLVQMAHDLGIRVIAEGIESEADLAWLQRHAVDYVQGFLLARPAPAPILTD
ncbi:EAL domain-containing protein [Roseospira goensis]|uniref:EAL domain-containing protein (Putative c-di-GMP-specific phosphodiesterase class I) n=1 Tax=Roseospira goensis TaxID=391922 RepID=A0A7W6RYF9_9PROT|nr:EAL domain-containing protein [Roseospira goensis]MBB4285386.1 EAL domain-containing protein (putative c-di-GMP-specific phosphodiesterase class I) [Roseospira goensis]